MEDNYIIAPVVEGQVYEPVVKVGDTLPIGAIIGFDTTQTIPNGWEYYAENQIKKIAPVTPANGNIENSYGTSQENTYSQEYINDTFQERTNFSYTLSNGIKFNFFKVGRIVQFEIEGTASSITAGSSYSATIDSSLAPSNDVFRTNFKYAEGSAGDSDYFGYATIIRDTNTNVVTATFRSQKAQSNTTYPRVEMVYISK